MKKIFTFLVFLTCYFIVQTVSASYVSIETAKIAANNWYQNQFQNKSKISFEKSIIRKINNKECLYIFILKNNAFIIVSADDNANPILAYSFENISLSEIYFNPIVDKWLDGYAEQIDSVKNKDNKKSKTIWQNLLNNNLVTEIDIKNNKSIQKGIKTEVSPLMQTAWNQNDPWNTFNPHDNDGYALSGCVAVTLAQIMRYHQHPDIGVGSKQYNHQRYGLISADFTQSIYNGGNPYDWNNMPYDSPNDNIRALLYYSSVSVEMDFGPDGSSADTKTMARNALIDNFKYASSMYYASKADYTSNEWETLLKQELSASRPLIYDGDNSSGTSGHAFICDGYNSSGYFHMNWGWSGHYDGYFSLSALTPDDDNYSYSQGAIFGIKPDPIPDLTYPYLEGFENEYIDNIILSGKRIYFTSESHSGSKAIMLNDKTSTDYNLNALIMKINVPQTGASLSFWVKRSYENGVSELNNQQAIIKPQYGNDILLTIFNGEYNDNEWQEYNVDLTPYKNQIITLYIEQLNKCDWEQWMLIDDISIKNEPVVRFEVDKTIAYINQEIKFNDQSVLVSSWSWDFGDGAKSELQNPTYKYTSPGLYTVRLTVNNSSFYEEKIDLIKVLPNKNTPYTIENGGNFEINADDYVSTALEGDINLWEHGTPSNHINNAASGLNVWKTDLDSDIQKGDYTCALYTPGFDFSKDGSYYVKFKYRMEIYYGNSPGAAWLEYSIDNGNTWKILGAYESNPEGTLNWYDQNVHEAKPEPFAWWDTKENYVQAVYNASELRQTTNVAFRFLYRVESRWVGTQTYQIDGFAIDDFEIEYLPPYADFTVNNKLAYKNIDIAFTDKSTLATSWLWDFGDGTNSTEQNPIHKYSRSGIYTVSLSVNQNASTETKTNLIHILPDRGTPYKPEDGGNFETKFDDFDSQSLSGDINIWERGTPENELTEVSSGTNAWKTDLDANITQASYKCVLQTPGFNLSASGNYVLQFNKSMSYIYFNGPFAVQVQYSIDRGQTWHRLGKENDPNGTNWYNRGPEVFINSKNLKIDQSVFEDETGWTTNCINELTTYSLDQFAGNSFIAFRFVLSVSGLFTEGFDKDGFMIDDFEIKGPVNTVTEDKLLFGDINGDFVLNIKDIIIVLKILSGLENQALLLNTVDNKPGLSHAIYLINEISK